jgi:hypothetical protein
MPWQLLTVQYAVRGELAIKADVLREPELKTPSHGLRFDNGHFQQYREPAAEGARPASD